MTEPFTCLLDREAHPAQVWEALQARLGKDLQPFPEPFLFLTLDRPPCIEEIPQATDINSPFVTTLSEVFDWSLRDIRIFLHEGGRLYSFFLFGGDKISYARFFGHMGDQIRLQPKEQPPCPK